MTRKTYICNVCRDEFASDAVSLLVGFDFPHPSATDAVWKQKPPMQSENHICRACLKNAADLYARASQRPVNA